MMIPEEFKDIRPFEPEELPEAIDRIFSSEQFPHHFTLYLP